jgi:hypothetical protein
MAGIAEKPGSGKESTFDWSIEPHGRIARISRLCLRCQPCIRRSPSCLRIWHRGLSMSFLYAGWFAPPRTHSDSKTSSLLLSSISMRSNPLLKCAQCARYSPKPSIAGDSRFCWVFYRRPRPRDRRHLRCHLLHGPPAHQRDWHSDGSRCTALLNSVDGPSPVRASACMRRSYRTGGSRPRRTPPQRVSLRRQPGSAGVVAVVAALVCGVGLAASALPTRGAASIDSVRALRAE